MALDLDRVRALDIAPIEHSYKVRDTMLYALGLGYGEDPLDPTQLQFVYEKGLKSAPSMTCILAHPGFWLQKPEFGADWVKILHAEQAFDIHATLPVDGMVRGHYAVSAVEDKGPGKGSLVHQIKTLFNVSSGEKLATVRSTLFLRGDGGAGSFGTPPSAPSALPEHVPDHVMELATSVRQALIYRLSGDWNPLHADPEIAKAAGFDRPILHGLCTNGIACRAVIDAYCGHDPDRLKSMFVRFSSPVIPGETIRVEFFEDADTLRFRARAVERDVIVLDRGSATIVGANFGM